MADKTPNMAAAIVDQIADEAMHVTDAEMLELGHFATTMVLARTKKGLDADLKPFKSYVPQYAKTRVRRGLRPSPPDLAVTGHMLGAMGPKLTGRGEVTVTFQSPREALKAEWNNDGTRRGMPKREFLDVRHPTEIKAMADAVIPNITLRVEKIVKK